MKIITEQSLRFFEFWSGAADNVAMLTTDELDQLDSILEDTHVDGISDVELNDLMWFEFETICEWLDLDYDPQTDTILRGEDND